jgi:hypothetical protein
MKHLFLTGFMACSLLATAQQANFKWGEQLDKEATLTTFLGTGSGNVYAIVARKDDLFLDGYAENTFRKKFATKLEFPDVNGANQSLEAVMKLNEKFVVFTSYYQRREKTFHVDAYSINEKGVLDRNSTGVIEIEVENRSEAGNIDFTFSSDSSNILVTQFFISRKTKEQTLRLFILNDALKITAQSEQTFPIKEGKTFTTLGKAIMGKTLDIFIPEIKTTPAAKGKPLQVEYSVLHFDASCKKLNNINIKADNDQKRVTKIGLFFDSQQRLIVLGSYDDATEAKKFTGLYFSGFFMKRIDPVSGQELTSADTPLTPEIIEGYYSAKQVEKRDPRVLSNNFLPDLIIERPDGGIACIFEEYTYQYSESQQGSVEVYYYGDLLVMDVAPDGKTNWLKYVPKRQLFIRRKTRIGIGVGGPAAFAVISTNVAFKADESIYLSYVATLTEDGNLVFIYNDEPANEKAMLPRETEMVRKIKETVPSMAVLDQSGTLRKKLLSSIPVNGDIRLRPQVSYNLDGNHILIYGSRKEQDFIGVMTIE